MQRDVHFEEHEKFRLDGSFLGIPFAIAIGFWGIVGILYIIFG